MTRAQVIDHKDLVKDLKSGAVINTNQSAYRQAIERVAKAKEEKERITKLEEEVSDIKNMLKQILEKVS
jgi:polyhydroxyalkanoate synthesis regulator phasin